jgi:hypothetical protein
MQTIGPAARRPLLAGLLGALLLSAAPAPRTGDVRAELDAIEKELRSEFQLMRNAVSDASGELAEEIATSFAQEILPEFLERLAALARANEGTPDAEDAWMRVIRAATMTSLPQPAAREALGALTTHHIDSKALGSLCRNLRYAAESYGQETVVATLEAIGEKSPHAEVRANALMALGGVLGENCADDDPRLARAREILRRVGDEYAAETSYDGRPCGEAARATLFELDNLRVGQTCPDFEAVDAEGATFKLSDYRGKVVLIDFWGFW